MAGGPAPPFSKHMCKDIHMRQGRPLAAIKPPHCTKASCCQRCCQEATVLQQPTTHRVPSPDSVVGIQRWTFRVVPLSLLLRLRSDPVGNQGPFLFHIQEKLGCGWHPCAVAGAGTPAMTIICPACPSAGLASSPYTPGQGGESSQAVASRNHLSPQ